MISKMAFGVKPVQEFLASNGCVLTVRGYDYTTTSATVPQLNDIRIIRSKVCEIKTIDDLNGFVPLSGFKTVSEWWIQIKRFCKGRIWLYRVRIDDTHTSKMESDYEKREQRTLFIDETDSHPLDIRHESKDPADIDLQPVRDAAHADRLQREADATQRRHERMRARYNGEITTVIPRTEA